MHHQTLIGILDVIAANRRGDLLHFKAEGRWETLSGDEFVARVRRLAACFIDFGVAPGDRIAILSENRPEWTITDFAIQATRAVNVPLFSTLSKEQMEFILRHSGASILVVSGKTQLDRVLPALGDLTPKPRVLLIDGSVPDGLESSGLEAALLQEALEHGEKALAEDPSALNERVRSVRPDDLASIIYTSGTTGEPKGVMLTHANFCANIGTCTDLVEFSSADLALSILPLSHVFERAVEYMYLSEGAAIAYVESIEKAITNFAEVRPTVFSTVPRLLEKVHARVLESVAAGGGAKRAIFRWALATAHARAQLSLQRRSVPWPLRVKHRIADRLVFAPLRTRLGGRIRFIVSGGAPLSRELGEFFLAAGLPVLEGYGLTETSPVIALNTFEHLRPGSVGPPLPDVEVRIASDGEILVKGPNVMKGYFGNPEATKAAMSDGFFMTGDIGRIDADGFLHVTDRKKDIIVTSGGKNIAPQPVESAIKASPYIQNVVLVGDRRKFVAALIVPDFGRLELWARSRGIPDGPRESLLARPEVRTLLDEEVQRAMAGFAAHEQVRRIAILSRDLSMEEGELTPTLKVRRRIVGQHFAEVIEALYTS